MSQTKAQLIGDLTQALEFITTASTPADGLYLKATNQIALATNSVDRITAGTSELVINESGASVDFRVEGDTDANLLFIDASADRIGVGTVSPAAKVEITHGNELGLLTSGPFNFQAKFESTDSEAAIVIEDSNSTNDGNRIGVIGDNMAFTTADTERLRIANDGVYTFTGGNSASDSGEIILSGRNSSNLTRPAGKFLISPNGSDSWTGLFTLQLRNDSGTFTDLFHVSGKTSNVGIMTTSPGAKLDVRGGSTGDAKIRLDENGSFQAALQLRGNDLEIRGSSGTIEFYRGNANEASSTEIARFDGSGKLLVNTSTSRSAWHNGNISSNLIQIERAGTGTDASISLCANSGTSGTTASAAQILLGKTRGSEVGATDAVASGDCLGRVSFQGSDNTQQVEAAKIEAFVDGTPGANDMPGKLVFSTTADNESSPTERMRIRTNGNIEIAQNNGSYAAALTFGAGSFPAIWRQGGNGSGIHFTTNATIPANENGNVVDNSESLGIGSIRWTQLFATSSTINTSDANEKQDIQSLSASELAVARELKNLIKKFRWRDAVAKKGDNARIHVGVIAQEVQQLFADHGLDATKYALWCSDTWYEVDGKPIASDGSHYTADSEGAVAKTRLGIRYEELLAFVLATL